MNYWIGVVGSSVSYERLVQGGDKSWFCLPSGSMVGDTILIYLTIGVAKSKSGIFAEYKVVQKDASKNSECRKYGTGNVALTYVEMKKIKELKSRVKMKKMREDPFLKEVGFVRRQGQGTYFMISEDVYKEILDLSEK